MTSKLSWIAFVPFAIGALAVEVIRLFFMDVNGTFFGLNNLTMSYIVIGCALAVFFFALIFCLIDRKSAQVYLLKKNVVSGLLGIIFAVVLACDGANHAFSAIRSMSFGALDIADIALTILCAIVFVVLGLNHFVGNGGVRGLAVFYLIPTVWSSLKLVKCFLNYTTVSITVTDVTVLACYVFLSLFLFNYAMIVALMKGKTPVKATIFYGMPAAIMLIANAVYELGNKIVLGNSIKFFTDIEAIEHAVLGVYILVFIIEVTSNLKRKDEIEILEDDDSEEYDKLDEPDSDIVDALSNSIINGNSPDKPVAVNTDLYTEDHLAIDDEVFIEVAQNSMDKEDSDDMDTSDFIYGSVPKDDEFILPTDIDADSSYEDVTVDASKSETAEHYITKEDSTYDASQEVAVNDVDDQMDRIDKLILEISEDELK